MFTQYKGKKKYLATIQNKYCSFLPRQITSNHFYFFRRSALKLDFSRFFVEPSDRSSQKSKQVELEHGKVRSIPSVVVVSSCTHEALV